MNTCVLISSCDKYSVCWEAQKHSMNKYWADCPFPIYMISNTKETPYRTIKVGKNDNWAKDMQIALQQIPYKTVLLLLDDYWLCAKVDTEIIVAFNNLCLNNNIANIRLTPSDEAIGSYDDNLKIMSEKAEYKTSLQPSIWNTEFLKSVILPKKGYHDDDPYYFTSWAFESEGTTRIHNEALCLTVKEHKYFHLVGQLDPLYYWKENPIVSGIWQKEVVQKYALQEGISIDTSINPNDNI